MYNIKKINYLWVLLFVPQILWAQYTATRQLHSPRAGDRLIKQELLYSDPGEVKMGQVWDFSSLPVANKEYPVDYFDLEGKLTCSRGRYLFKYELKGDSLLLSGREDSFTNIRYHEPQLLMKFPLSYPSLSEGKFSGRGKYCDRMQIYTEGTVSSQVDATGTLILPGGDTLQSVIRVHIVNQGYERFTPLPASFDITLEVLSLGEEETLDSSFIQNDIYLWYAEGSRYPVMEMSRTLWKKESGYENLEETALLFHPLEQLAQLPDDEENVLILTAQKEKKQIIFDVKGIDNISLAESVSVYPNPVTDYLRVDLSGSETVTTHISLYDMTGKKVYESQVQAGEMGLTINMTQLPQGNYVLKVKTSNNVIDKKIIKLQQK